MTEQIFAPMAAPPQVVSMQIGGQQSLGIWVSGQSDIAVLMVSGGAQTRAGSHRMQQQLAKGLQQQHISSLRFDFPGYGDATGQTKDFTQHALWLPEVIATAQKAMPQVKHWVMFGLCDGASAILLSPPALEKAAGLILLNPWCRAEQNHAQTMVRFYYWQRFTSRAFWRKLLTGQVRAMDSLRQFVLFWRRANSQTLGAVNTPVCDANNFLPHLVQHWTAVAKPMLLTLSDQDLTAQECALLITQRPEFQKQQMKQHLQVKTLHGANHTCSDATHFKQLQQTISQWIVENFPQSVRR